MLNTMQTDINPGQHRIFACLLLGMLLLVSGCASLKKGECLEGDWGGIGFRDGAAGYDSASRLTRHSKACGKHGVTPDHELYNEGHAQGLETFCTTPEGYTYGRKGSEYRGICPVALEKDFLKGYVEGLKVAEDRIDDELYRLDSRKDDAQFRYSILVGTDGADPKDVKEARNDVDYLKSSINSTRQERRKLRRMLDVWNKKLLENL